MIVCLDVQSAVTQRAGVGRYTRSLAQHLAATATEETLRLTYFDFRRRCTPFPAPGAQWKAIRWCPGSWAQASWKLLGWPPYQMFAGRADLYHFPNFVRPPLTRGRSVVTLHDLSYLHYPQCAESRNLRYLHRFIPKTVRDADAILTGSRCMAEEIQRCLGVPSDRIFAVPYGIDSHFRPPPPDQLAIVRRRLSLDRPYLLGVGTMEPRKNWSFLFDVFDRLLRFDGQLVLVGMPGWKHEPILNRMRQARRSTSIRWLRYVADVDLPALYAGAELFVCVSLYEGFGFPPLEAMACGTPVVSSAGGALAEILGDAAIVLHDFDPEHWVATLERVLFDSSERARLSAAGRTRAGLYRWEDTARGTWQVYRTVLQR